ncbi:MAG: TadE/TadG family type IV pilus assembly protein [Actinomycetota bacterium]
MMRGRADGERGAATVEFVLVLPVLLALVGTVMFGGWLATVRTILEHGATEGARYASVPTTPDLRTYPAEGAVAARVDEVTPLISPTSVQVTSSFAGAARNAPVTVRATYSVPNPVAVLLAPLEALGWSDPVPDTITVSASAQGRRE